MWESILAASIVMLVFVLATLALWYALANRGLRRQREHFARLHAELAPGQVVTFGNGIYGTTVAVYEDTADIQVKSGAVLTVSRYAISAIVRKEKQHAQHRADAH